jgi:hypothetical protein
MFCLAMFCIMTFRITMFCLLMFCITFFCLMTFHIPMFPLMTTFCQTMFCLTMFHLMTFLSNDVFFLKLTKPSLTMVTDQAFGYYLMLESGTRVTYQALATNLT